MEEKNEESKNTPETSTKENQNEVKNEEITEILKIDEEQKKISENENIENRNENPEKEKEKEKNNDKNEEKIEIDEESPKITNIHNRSPLSLEGAKYPISMYTRRVMNVSKIKDILKEDSSAGICGGYNLGNTCFMNSSIACISNCIELTYYFLCGDYKMDINTENKNGFKGELAKSWGDLLQEYWVENTKVGDPREFKNIIGQKAIRFRGYGQQDSNEFMNIFLDYLNEDLNSVSKKEYIELDEKKENESDEECSKRFWDANLKRNDSIITDLFCGQFKSTVICTNCNWISITFEPFYSISLPLKESKKKNKNYFMEKDIDEYNIFYVPKYGLRTPYKFVFSYIPNTTKLCECFEAIKNDEKFKYFGKVKKVKYMKIDSRQFQGELEEDDIIDEYNQNVFLFEINGEENNDLKIPIYFVSKNEGGEQELSAYPRFIFGKEDITIEELKKNIYYIIRKHILSPFLKYGEEIDEISDLIIKSKTEMSIDDDYLIELIDKEYQKIFSETPSGLDIEYLQNYIQDMPFNLTLKEIEGTKTINIFNSQNMNMVSDEFKELTEVSSIQSCIKDFIDKISDFALVVEFNIESKYINKKNFKLDNCFVRRINFPEKEKKEEEKEKEEEDKKQNIFDCFNYFCQEEQLKKGNEWYCKNCKKHVLPKKKIDFYYLPKILIICFKRFIKDSSYSWEKNDEEIDFPINNFDMKDLIIGPDKDHSIYDLFAVSQHYGSTGSGHYTALCKNNNKWYDYDDSSVRETSPRAALTSAAYVLFYRRQTD